MSNMSYCRFQNTLADFADCQIALTEMADGNEQPLSRNELMAAKALAQEAADLLQFLADYTGRSVDDLMDTDGFADAIEQINVDAKNANDEDEDDCE